jgi:hypothetical protein
VKIKLSSLLGNPIPWIEMDRVHLCTFNTWDNPYD